MKKIEKKVWPQYFQAVFEGNKNYELRLNDFEVEIGDILVLREWDPVKKEYSGRMLEKEVTYVGKFDISKLFWPKEKIEKQGLMVISLK